MLSIQALVYSSSSSSKDQRKDKHELILLCRNNRETEKEKRIHTWKIPWIVFVDINLFDELNTEWFLVNLSSKIEPNKFFISWVEAKPRKRNFFFIIIQSWRSISIVGVHVSLCDDSGAGEAGL